MTHVSEGVEGWGGECMRAATLCGNMEPSAFSTEGPLCSSSSSEGSPSALDIYTELSIVKAKAERDLGRLRDQLQMAHQALGEPSLEELEQGGYVREAGHALGQLGARGRGHAQAAPPLSLF
ncbi:hypothetical protein CRUP_013833, partial [Coryphaenoides rupestris]